MPVETLGGLWRIVKSVSIENNGVRAAGRFRALDLKLMQNGRP